MMRIDCRGVSTEGLADSEQIRAASDCYIKNGYAILDNILPEAKIAALHVEFQKLYRDYLDDVERDDSVEVGKSRFLMHIRLCDGFGDPMVYANPYVLALVRKVLGADAILEAFGAVVSLPGSAPQHVHADGRALFNSEISSLLPSHALTFALPLIEMNETHGSTAIWAGSQRWAKHKDDAPSEVPTIPSGSGMMWDFRTYHSGTPNRSNQARPMLYMTYARPWFRDPLNFWKEGQRRLIFGAGFVESLTDDTRPLFSQMLRIAPISEAAKTS